MNAFYHSASLSQYIISLHVDSITRHVHTHSVYIYYVFIRFSCIYIVYINIYTCYIINLWFLWIYYIVNCVLVLFAIFIVLWTCDIIMLSLRSLLYYELVILCIFYTELSFPNSRYLKYRYLNNIKVIISDFIFDKYENNNNFSVYRSFSMHWYVTTSLGSAWPDRPRVHMQRKLPRVHVPSCRLQNLLSGKQGRQNQISKSPIPIQRLLAPPPGLAVQRPHRPRDLLGTVALFAACSVLPLGYGLRLTPPLTATSERAPTPISRSEKVMLEICYVLLSVSGVSILGADAKVWIRIDSPNPGKHM